MSILWAGDCWASLPSQTGHGAAISQQDLQVYSSHSLGHRKLPQWVQGELVADLGWSWTCTPQVHLKGMMFSAKARGFELSYLGKLSTVKDTHTRQPLLHHVCVLLMQLYPHSSDLHSDITAVTKASKVITRSFTCVSFFLVSRSNWDSIAISVRVRFFFLRKVFLRGKFGTRPIFFHTCCQNASEFQ